MLKVGITGGIGSGKSTVCKVFTTLGIPVFYADDAAKYLMNNDEVLARNIKAIFGEDIYRDHKLDSDRVSSIVFKYPDKLKELNALVHPATIAYGKQWMESQRAPYVVKEAAIFFESGSNKDMDVMIGVSAPIEIRVQRAMARGNVTREQVLERMAQQMNEDEKMKLCDHVIINDENTAIIPQVLDIHKKLLGE